MKRKISGILALLLVAILMSANTAASASSKPSASTSKYISAYALTTSGKIYGYTDEALTKKATNWIDASADECRIVQISNNGKAVKVSYPLDSGGRSTAWFERSAFTTFDLTKDYDCYAIERVNVYRRSDGKSGYGYAESSSTSDKVYILGKSGSYTQIIYQLSSGVFKMAWAKTSEIKKMNTSFDPVWPCASAYKVTCLYYYKDGSEHSTRYGYANAMDITGGGDIVATEAGTVETVKNLGDSGFGRYIVIKHPNGTKSLYAHLKSVKVEEGDTVKRNQTIGVMGTTGNSSGVHLHFELSTADPWNTYFKSVYKEKISFQLNVRSNNVAKYDGKKWLDTKSKTIVNWIDSYYKKSGDYYVIK